MAEYRFDIEQNTDEWFAEKVRRVGASSAPALLMDKKTKGYQALKNRLVEEIITGERTESNVFKGNSYTERGHEFEPVAREDYELRNFEIVKLIGCVILDEWVMCSPDGLIGDKKLHQIKCPIFNTQKEYLKVIRDNINLNHNQLLRKIDFGYYKQVQFELYVTGRDINIWTSFHPNLEPIDLVIERDADLIVQIEERICDIKKEVLNEIKELQ